MKVILFGAVMSILLAGCFPAIQYDKEGVTESERRRLFAECQFEAEKAVASYSTGYRTRGLADAIGTGMGEGFDLASRKYSIIKLCLQAHGYTIATRGTVIQPPQPAARELTQQASAPRTDPTLSIVAPVALTPARPVLQPGSSETKWKFYAERIAQGSGCTDNPIGSLSAKGPALETYSFICTNGDVLSVRCEYGNCRELR